MKVKNGVVKGDGSDTKLVRIDSVNEDSGSYIRVLLSFFPPLSHGLQTHYHVWWRRSTDAVAKDFWGKEKEGPSARSVTIWFVVLEEAEEKEREIFLAMVTDGSTKQRVRPEWLQQYELMGKIGEGTYGLVYLARSKQPSHRQVLGFLSFVI